MAATPARLTAATIALLVVLAAAPTAKAAHDDSGVRIATLDSGIRDTHEAFASDQIVAWQDFVNGQTEPYDDHGHGTAVASMAAGLNVGPQTPSHAAGTSLIVGKVLSANNFASWADTTQAIDWAVDEGADVLTLSIYAYSPRPGTDAAFGYSTAEQQLFDAIEGAVDHGVFVTILAGNGLFNSGLPTMSWLHPPATSPGALVVGGADAQGVPTAPRSSMEPEVTAPFSVDVAAEDCDACYRSWQGTSFSTPLVAGIGVRVIGEAQAQGIAAEPALVEDAIQLAAEDTPAPPTLEGYGFLDADAASQAEAELPDPQPDTPAERANQFYVEQVQDNQRQTWYDLHR